MANPLLGLTFLAPTVATATQEAAGHPVTNVLLAPKWRRTWRATSTTNGTSLVVDFGVTTLLSGFFLNAGNFSGVKAAGSANGSTWVELYASATAFPLEDRVRQTRHKGWFPATGWGNVFNHRYFRLECHTIDAGQTAFELGSLAFPTPSGLETMVQGWTTPYQTTAIEPHTALDYPGGGGEANLEGPEIVRFDVAGGPWRTSAKAQLLRVRKLGIGAPFFLFENRGNLAHAYLVKRLQDATMGERVPTFDMALTLEECV